MGLFSSLMGRTKPVQSNLDALFALPSASITLQSAAGMSCSGHAGVCYKPPTGQGFEQMQAEVVELLSMDGTGGLHQQQDSYGYHWLVVEDTDIEQLVTRIHLVNSSYCRTPAGAPSSCARCSDWPICPPPSRSGHRSGLDPVPTACPSWWPVRDSCSPRRHSSSTCSSGTPPVRAPGARTPGHRGGVEAEEPGGRRSDRRGRPRPLVPAVGPPSGLRDHRGRVLRVMSGTTRPTGPSLTPTTTAPTDP